MMSDLIMTCQTVSDCCSSKILAMSWERQVLDFIKIV